MNRPDNVLSPFRSDTDGTQELTTSRKFATNSTAAGLSLSVAASALSKFPTLRGELLLGVDRLCQKYQSIIVDPAILNGVPHLRNHRLTVAQVLARLSVFGSIQSLIEFYSANITKQQIEDALNFAHDFLQLPYDSQIDD